MTEVLKPCTEFFKLAGSLHFKTKTEVTLFSFLLEKDTMFYL